MAYDIHFSILVLFVVSAIAVGTLGLLLRPRVPLFLVTSGILWFVLFVAVDNVVVGEPLIANTTNTITPTDTAYMNVVVSSTSNIIRSGSQIFVGEEISNANSALYNKRVDLACVTLSKTGSPTGTANIAIYDSVVTPTSSNYKYLFGTKDVSTITTSVITYCFFGTNEYITTTNEAIGVFYNGGSAGNELNIYFNMSNIFDGTNSYKTTYVASWADQTTVDLRAKVALTGIQEQIVNKYLNNGTTYDLGLTTNQGAQVKMFFLIFGISFMFIGAIEQKYGV